MCISGDDLNFEHKVECQCHKHRNCRTIERLFGEKANIHHILENSRIFGTPCFLVWQFSTLTRLQTKEAQVAKSNKCKQNGVSNIMTFLLHALLKNMHQCDYTRTS